MACISNGQCSSGNCFKGKCTTPSGLGEPCNNVCEGGLICDARLKRCVKEERPKDGFCRGDYDCTHEQFCNARIRLCDPVAPFGALCGVGRPCGDGLECYQDHCHQRCQRQDDCIRGGECQQAGSVFYKLCLGASMGLPKSYYYEVLAVFLVLFLIILVLFFIFASHRYHAHKS